MVEQKTTVWQHQTKFDKVIIFAIVAVFAAIMIWSYYT